MESVPAGPTRHGIDVAFMPVMTTPVRSPRVPESSHPVLLWVFRRGVEAITCEVDVTRSGACEVRTIPQWDASLAMIETFTNPVDALRRHAEIATRLREIGWSVADHVPVQPVAA